MSRTRNQGRFFLSFHPGLLVLNDCSSASALFQLPWTSMIQTYNSGEINRSRVCENSSVSDITSSFRYGSWKRMKQQWKLKRRGKISSSGSGCSKLDCIT